MTGRSPRCETKDTATVKLVGPPQTDLKKIMEQTLKDRADIEDRGQRAEIDRQSRLKLALKYPPAPCQEFAGPFLPSWAFASNY
jgi:hypothetical protein